MKEEKVSELPRKEWSLLSAEEVTSALETDAKTGLSSKEARKRLESHGPNIWAKEKRTHPVVMFLSQFIDPIVLILLAALVVAGVVLGEWIDAAAIGVILLLNAVLGFVQEFRAERAMAALKKLTAPVCRVKRDGKITEINTEDLVPGDMVLIGAGDKIPADGRLIDAKHILIDESSLTGESVPVDKQTGALVSETRLVAEKHNMAFLGTSVAKGRGSFIVTDTGRETELGKVAESLEQKREKTPLQKDLGKLGTRILIIVIVTCVVVFLVELFKLGTQTEPGAWIEPLLVAIALAVAAIPEGLPAAVTISLALGIRKMAEKKAIIRRMHAVETLGCTSFICTDKTGTLTENQMQVEKIIPVKTGDEKSLIQVMLLCNDTHRSGEEFLGDPTETALVRFADGKGYSMEELVHSHPRVDEIAFDSDRKMMTTLHRWEAGFLSATKGAPEEIITRSANLDSKRRDEWLGRCHELSADGYRLLGLARKKVSRSTAHSSLEQDLEFLGLVAESDPPRKEVPAALLECQNAGIGVAMITGDHMATARAIAKRIGLSGEALSGEEVENMTDEELYDKAKHTAVYARVSPLQKVRILEALKYHGHVVAMTGDGVNDAPALKRADIGVSMGITGTDVAVEASQMVLTDDNFATIVAAVRQGRIIFENIKKFVHFLLSCNVSEVLTIFLASILGMPPPLFPIQILWVNLITDGLPALALGSDKPSGNPMKAAPRKKSEGIITQMGLLGIILQGLLLTVGVLGAYAFSLYLMPKWFNIEMSDNIARTITFSTLVFSQLLHAFNFRVGRHFFFSRETLRNWFLNGAVLASLALQAGIIYFGPARAIFKTVPLDWPHLVLVGVCSLVPVLLINLIRRLLKIK
ncbi:calcium-translocating P-type ATPase, PMCA-type [candidate division WOR-3 bacterium]|nr:calcium-translocating P-type ATPase, PMCA-type [candidate division WOR-3 bacterium]